MKERLILTLALVLLAPTALAQHKPYFTKLQDSLPHAKKSGMGELIAEIGSHFLKTPYEGHTLEGKGEEQLTVRFESFDCFTFVESSLALARTLKRQQPEFNTFQAELERIRYRSGRLDGYTSRLHYTSDWAWDNATRGILTNMTPRIGGVPYEKTIDFMTQHTSAYRQLASQERVEAMQKIEDALNSREHYFLPKNKIRQQEHLILQGDIIALTSAVKGLDVAHVGLAVTREGRLYLLHASSKSGLVEISQNPLHEYLATMKNRTGIMVFRACKP